MGHCSAGIATAFKTRRLIRGYTVEITEIAEGRLFVTPANNERFPYACILTCIIVAYQAPITSNNFKEVRIFFSWPFSSQRPILQAALFLPTEPDLSLLEHISIEPCLSIFRAHLRIGNTEIPERRQMSRLGLIRNADLLRTIDGKDRCEIRAVRQL